MKTFIRILKFAKPYKFIVLFAFISSILFGLFNAMSLWVASSLIGTIMGAGQKIPKSINTNNTIHNKLDQFFDHIIHSNSPIEQIKIVCLCLFISFFFKNVFYYINWMCISFVELRIIRDIRNKLYTKVQNFPVSFFDKNKSANILSIMLNDINWIKIAFDKTFQVFFHESISILILFILLFSISFKLSLLVLIIFPISGFIIIQIGKSIKRRAKRASFKISHLSHIVSEKLMGIRIVKAYNMTIKEIENFIRNNHSFYRLQFKQKRLLGLTTPINDIIGVILAVVLLWFGGQQVLLYGSMSSEEFMRFIIFLFALLQPARKLGGSLAAVQTGIAGASRVFDIFDLNFNKNTKTKINSLDNFNSNIKLKDVSFKYDENGKDILRNLNVTIKKGEKIALVGKSGSGKTTFANLLLNFYFPSSGEIYIDDIDYNNIKSTSIRNLIGLVSQEPILFNDTIVGNISYGQDKNISNEKIKAAAINANIDKYINSLEKGYDSIIGERGINLSGGQKQRISIARAILKNSPILILDEATSSLDSESEIKVQKAIDNLVKDRTVIMIAHRLSTIKNADTILVFDDGQIVEKGNHQGLYDLNGVYKRLYQLQFEGNFE